jgi:hypothetical protein
MAGHMPSSESWFMPSGLVDCLLAFVLGLMCMHKHCIGASHNGDNGVHQSFRDGKYTLSLDGLACDAAILALDFIASGAFLDAARLA